MSDMTRSTPPTELTCDEVRDLAASYVLGALDGDQVEAVRAHLADHPDGHPEMGELASVLPILAASAPVVEPPAGLKARIMAAAAADLETRGGGGSGPAPMSRGVEGTGAEPTAGAAPTAFPSQEDREARAAAKRATSPATWLLRIAAILAIAVLGGWNLLLQGQLDQARTYQENVAAVLDAAGEPGALVAVLTGEGTDAPTGIAALTTDGAVTLAMRDLVPTTGTQVYETWVIGGDGVPVAVGGFTVDATGTGYFEGQDLPVAEGIVLALTLEPAPGATAPSSPPVSAGTVTAAG